MNNVIFLADSFQVRSKVALGRRKIAKSNNIPIDQASYRLHHWETLQVSLLDNVVETDLSKDQPAIFFDQTPYTFVVSLPKGTLSADIFSPSATWCESADWDDEYKKLMIQVNFGNDIGDFKLQWEWRDENNQLKTASFSAQVYSTKLDIHTDFGVMIKEVQERFDWIELDLLRQTQWGWSNDNNKDSSLNTWLLIFQDVREKMDSKFRSLIIQHR